MDVGEIYEFLLDSTSNFKSYWRGGAGVGFLNVCGIHLCISVFFEAFFVL
jgi:hypothetical protein